MREKYIETKRKNKTKGALADRVAIIGKNTETKQKKVKTEKDEEMK